MRALSWGNDALFGGDRVKSLAAWPLHATLQVPQGQAPAYDPKQAWTMVAGGDILLDRGVKLAIDGHASGTDFPFNGGFADITGTCKNCSPFGWDTPYTKRAGQAGAVRDLFKGADVAIANFENPAPNNWRFHPSGTVFSANPANIAALQDAGFDWVSMANNHIGDAGRPRDPADDEEPRQARHRARGRRSQHDGGAQGGAHRGRRRDGRPAGLRHHRAARTGRRPTARAART